jgi:hypothetical protein
MFLLLNEGLVMRMVKDPRQSTGVANRFSDHPRRGWVGEGQLSRSDPWPALPSQDATWGTVSKRKAISLSPNSIIRSMIPQRAG